MESYFDICAYIIRLSFIENLNGSTICNYDLRAKTTPKTTNQAAKANKENFCMIPLGTRNTTTPEKELKI